MNSTRLFAIILKELRQLRRDRLTFGMILGIPALQLLLFGFAINMDIRNIDSAFVDQARTVHSREVIASQDVSALCLVPGVGNKTAARLLVELQSRLDLPDIDLTPSPGAVVTTSARRDVTEALAGLGYGPDEVRRVVDDLPSDGEPADLLREALRRLAVA